LRLTRAIFTIGLCCLLLGACATTAGDSAEIYVVRAHDTLYSIAWRHDLDYRDLARWNNLGADFHISVGQALVLRPSGAPSVQRTGPARRPTASAPSSPLPAATPWVWPTDRAGAPRAVPGGGILLSGRLGQDVRAASSGRVVYNGSGLRGYGNLIIIKHADNLLSAYGHNREMLVRDGQEVAAGQVIAHMGVGAEQSPVLYFEIRQNGRTMDPLSLISK
jgi:lipoprotein NlpD